jgi:pimeloyl-ACP methyl ester carboxylesterase
VRHRCRFPGGRRQSHSTRGLWATPGDVPYLVIQGVKDETAPVEIGHLLEEFGARVTVVDIPNARHLQPVEAAGPVAEAVIGFAR